MTLFRPSFPSKTGVPGRCSRLPGTNFAGCSPYKSTVPAISNLYPVGVIFRELKNQKIFSPGIKKKTTRVRGYAPGTPGTPGTTGNIGNIGNGFKVMILFPVVFPVVPGDVPGTDVALDWR